MKQNPTATSDAMARAGFDTTTAELRQLIADAMKQTHGNVPKALQIFDSAALSKAQLSEIKRACFVSNLPQQRDQMNVDPQFERVSPAADTGGGHADVEPQPLNAASGTTSAKLVPVKRHKRHRPKSKELREREFSVQVHAVFKSRKIGDRYIGQISWGELTALSVDRAINGAKFIEMSVGEIETSLLLHYLKQTCQVDDHSRLVQDVVSPAQFLQAEMHARKMTPQVLELVKQRDITTVRNPEQIEDRA